MSEKIRLLPFVIFLSLVLFTVKAGDIWSQIGVRQAMAEVPQDNLSAADGNMEANQSGEAVRKNSANAVNSGLQSEVHDYSRAEIEVLQNLSTRRANLDKRNKSLDLQDKLLQVTERRVDAKIADLKVIEARIRKLFKQYDAEAEQRLKSLVKIYESMKPKDAARIFDNLDMDIMLSVASRMKESKMAAVLANMTSQTAKELTIELAKKDKITLEDEEPEPESVEG